MKRTAESRMPCVMSADLCARLLALRRTAEAQGRLVFSAEVMHYGRTHIAHGMGRLLYSESIEPLAVPVTSAGPLEAKPLMCVPPKPGVWWLRRGGSAVANLALAGLIP